MHPVALTKASRAGYASARLHMDSSTSENGTERGGDRIGASLRERPLVAGFVLGLEYAMFASAVGLALGLFATRVPLRVADRMFGLRLRERFVELLARVSPG
jgi:hypothetical protein